MNSHRIGCRQRHDRDRDRRAVHVDGRAKRDGYRIHILVKSQLLTKLHVHGDISCAAACKERCDPALAKASEYQRIGVSSHKEKCDQRIDHQRDEHHAADKHQKQLSVVFKYREPVLGNRAEYQTADSERRAVDDPAHYCGNSLRGILEHCSRLGSSDLLKRDAEHNGPEQDSDIIAVNDRGYRVLHHSHKKILQDLSDILRDRIRLRRLAELKRHREQEACSHACSRCEECAEHIEEQHKSELAVQSALTCAESADDQHKYENGGDRPKSAHKKCSQKPHPCQALEYCAKDRADYEADHDAEDQACTCVFVDCVFDEIHNSPLFLHRIMCN